MQAILALADELHFGRAAARLGVAQPRLTQLIKLAESAAGVMLFQRSTRSTTLTPAGEVLVAGIRNGFEQMDRALSEARHRACGLSDPVRVGYVARAMLMGLPRAVAAFRAEFPSATLNLHEVSSDLQVVMLKQGALDIAIVTGPVRSPDLVTSHKVADELILAFPADHRLAVRGAATNAIDLSDVADEPRITFHRSEAETLFDAIAGAWARSGRARESGQVAHSWHSILSLVAAGLGVALVPASTRAYGIQGLGFGRITGPAISVPLCVHRRPAALSPQVPLFESILQRFLRAPQC